MEITYISHKFLIVQQKSFYEYNIAHFDKNWFRAMSLNFKNVVKLKYILQKIDILVVTINVFFIITFRELKTQYYFLCWIKFTLKTQRSNFLDPIHFVLGWFLENRF